MKKKIVALCLIIALATTAIVGGTLAYFTDTDQATNVFTTGNVDIQINEKVDEDTHLMPGKKINKDVFVQNTGTEPAYVRVHIGIPANMDDGDPDFAAYKNFLHWNFTQAGIAAGQWNWSDSATGSNYPGNGGSWNYYTTTVNGQEYAVYVATYMSELAPGAETATESLTQVYMDATVDATSNEDGTITYEDSFGNKVTLDPKDDIKIEVFAEGTQVEGFEDPYTALDTAFGAVGSYNPWGAAPQQ